MGTSGMGYGGDHGNMQPHYLGELSKTSRTLGADDLDNQVSMIRSNHGQMRSSQAARKVQRVHRRVKVRVIPYFQRKHRLGQRRIIQKPWSRPMAAQHLAAIKIQGLIRRFLYKKRRETGLWIPYFQEKRLE